MVPYLGFVLDSMGAVQPGAEDMPSGGNRQKFRGSGFRQVLRVCQDRMAAVPDW
jgi:hypothetical protein